GHGAEVIVRRGPRESCDWVCEEGGDDRCDCPRHLIRCRTAAAYRFVAGLDPDAHEARFVRPAASMTLMGPAATTRVIMKPLFVSSSRNSCSVRSDPPRPRSMLRSLRTLARCSALSSDASGMIRSTSSSLPGGPSARRQFARILTLRSSSQSWITLFKINASAPEGTDSKKFPARNSHRSPTPASVRCRLAPSPQRGRSKIAPSTEGYAVRITLRSSPCPPPTSINFPIPVKSYAPATAGATNRVSATIASLNGGAFPSSARCSNPFSTSRPASSGSVLPVRIESISDPHECRRNPPSRSTPGLRACLAHPGRERPSPDPCLHLPARQLRLRLASPDRIDQRPPRVPEEPAFQKHPWLEGLPGASREVAAQLRQLEGVLVRLGAKVKSHEGAEKAAQRRS